MVKIVNDHGDFKRGKQGVCAYQGHYGNQIRRTISPKRPMATTPQVSQRARFIAGLQWRKLLSRADKIYLDGYSLAHRLVDTLGVPLTWDKLAMRFATAAPTVQVLYRY